MTDEQRDVAWAIAVSLLAVAAMHIVTAFTTPEQWAIVWEQLT